MPTVFDKLNLKDQREILVLNAPQEFEKALSGLRGVKVLSRIEDVKSCEFALTFATQRAELDRLARALCAIAAGDAMLWFAYPKGTSKKYVCEFNRDDGWQVLRQCGFDSVRQIAIDDDWSALRFRRVEYIKRMNR
ncbi:MAG TPA: hypothetical protein VKG05_16890 [Steroidobacteraceae bacterium]|nr:hypothetical protein [Steroidobacteraceae bacterium]